MALANFYWDDTKPVVSLAIADIPEAIRHVRNNTEVVLSEEHSTFPDGSNTDACVHDKGSAHAFHADYTQDLDTNLVNRPGGTALDSADAGRLAIDANATDVGKFYYWDGSNWKWIGGLVLDENNMVSDSDTSLATQQSIKAYMEANVPTGLAGSNDDIGEASIGELELKWGRKGVSGTTTAVDFTTEGLTDFTGHCYQVVVSSADITINDTGVTNLSATGFTIIHATDVNNVRWFAIGH